jgi:predicted nucleic-acid-binding protein
VALELEWVLRSRFDFTKQEVVSTLTELLTAAELGFESEDAIEQALQLFMEGAADFSDCIHIALASQYGEEPLWTFDKAAARIPGAQILR